MMNDENILLHTSFFVPQEEERGSSGTCRAETVMRLVKSLNTYTRLTC